MQTRLSLSSFFLSALLFLALAQIALAGSATWKPNPADDNWNNAGNWTPATVPNGVSDVATFGVSSVTTVGVDVSAFHPLAEIVFQPGASAFTFNVTGDLMTLEGAGITNSSGTNQTFAISEGQSIGFQNSATAGIQTSFTLPPKLPFLPGVVFYGAATAGSATFTINGSVTGDVGGELQFINFSSAADAVVTNLGGNGTSSQGGLITFYDSAGAGNGIFTNEGGVGSGALGASTVFADTSDAENATLIANGGTDGGAGGTIKFINNTTGGNPRVELFGNGTLDIHLASGRVAVGSLEGDGIVNLGPNRLTVGGNALETSFRGLIEGSGSLSKIKRGLLILTGSNTYSGGTNIVDGFLSNENVFSAGSLGSGPVRVNGGTLCGKGQIGSDVTVGNGKGSFGTLSPGINKGESLGFMDFLGTLRFKTDGIYRVDVNSDTRDADLIFTQGVTIDSTGSVITIADIGHSTLPAGALFLLIDNLNGPIDGTFSNLPDGSTITIGKNTYQVSYLGGRGLSLTVVQ
jgi:autotransporter-associated beta strand protein